MARAKFQVLVIPFFIINGEIEYCIFLRRDMDIWQFISGGGENNETYLESAKRESFEEAKIKYNNKYYKLDTCCSISVECFNEEDRKRWGENIFVIPEYTFAVNISEKNLQLSDEHDEYRWLDYKSAKKLLRYDSNVVALSELNSRIERNLLGREL